MIFFWAETPDGWGIPGIHGPWAEDELDGYVQNGVWMISGLGENMCAAIVVDGSSLVGSRGKRAGDEIKNKGGINVEDR